LGSNLLVRDGGFHGTVVLMHSPHGAMRIEGDLIYAEASVECPMLAHLAATRGFGGAEFLAGVPGTVGGALAMNAGCYGSETWDAVAKALTISRAGRLNERKPADFEVGYRRVALRGSKLGEEEWFLAAWLRFRAGDQKRARARIKELLAKRIAEQPLDLPNAGSVFRNPPGKYAARLIEASGLKGYEIGGARISEKHANFIVNPKGRARASDIEALIERARAPRDALHGLGRSGERARDGQVAHQARLAGERDSDAALRASHSRNGSSWRRDAAGAPPDDQARQRRLLDRYDQGEERPRSPGSLRACRQLRPRRDRRNIRGRRRADRRGAGRYGPSCDQARNAARVLRLRGEVQ